MRIASVTGVSIFVTVALFLEISAFALLAVPRRHVEWQ